MYRPITKVTGTGNVLSDGSAVPAFICGAAGTYTFKSPGGVTFDVFATGQSEIIEITIKEIITNPGSVTIISQ